MQQLVTETKPFLQTTVVDTSVIQFSKKKQKKNGIILWIICSKKFIVSLMTICFKTYRMLLICRSPRWTPYMRCWLCVKRVVCFNENQQKKKPTTYHQININIKFSVLRFNCKYYNTKKLTKSRRSLKHSRVFVYSRFWDSGFKFSNTNNKVRV